MLRSLIRLRQWLSSLILEATLPTLFWGSKHRHRLQLGMHCSRVLIANCFPYLQLQDNNPMSSEAWALFSGSQSIRSNQMKISLFKFHLKVNTPRALLYSPNWFILYKTFFNFSLKQFLNKMSGAGAEFPPPDTRLIRKDWKFARTGFPLPRRKLFLCQRNICWKQERI